MNLFKLFAALALLSAPAGTPAFSETLRRQACHNHVSSRGKRTGTANQCWCLHNYSADEIDCSYVDRSQCRLHARAAGPPHIWTQPWWVACSKTPSHDRRRTASAAWPQRGSVFHQGRIEKTSIYTRHVEVLRQLLLAKGVAPLPVAPNASPPASSPISTSWTSNRLRRYRYRLRQCSERCSHGYDTGSVPVRRPFSSKTR
jgi:hypothetical protein